VLHHARGRRAFLSERIPAHAGAIVDTHGATLGAHEGIAAFTIGQRRGLGVAAGMRRYVVDVDARTATVTLGERSDLLRKSVVLRDVTFVDATPEVRDDLTVQTRAHGAVVGAAFDGTTVHFATPQPRVAPGQVVALYAGDALLGAASPPDRTRRTCYRTGMRTGSRRSAALRSISSRRATATMISAVVTVAPPCRPRAARREVDRLVEAHRHRAGPGAQARSRTPVGRVAGVPGPRGARAHAGTASGSARLSGSTTTKPAGTSTANGGTANRGSGSAEHQHRAATNVTTPSTTRRRRAAALGHHSAITTSARPGADRGTVPAGRATDSAARRRTRSRWPRPTRCRVPTRASAQTTLAASAPTVAIVDASPSIATEHGADHERRRDDAQRR
jgi:hypothetical protein